MSETERNPLEPLPGETQFLHRRTGPKRALSTELHTVHSVQGKAPHADAWHVLNEHHSSFYIKRQADGTWIEI